MPANTQPIFSSLGDIEWGTTAITWLSTGKSGYVNVLPSKSVILTRLPLLIS